MTNNILMLNDDKTKVILFTSKYNPSVSVTDFTIPIDDLYINPTASVRNLGVMLDKHMTMVPHANYVCRSACILRSHTAISIG